MTKSAPFKLLVIASLLVSAHGVCIPGQVQNIQLQSNFTLTWEAALNPNNCKISKYYVNIFDTSDDSDRQYEASGLSLNVSFLDSCKYYGFEIHAFTDESDLGPSYREFAKTSLPSVVDLSLNQLNPTITKGQSIQVSWTLKSPKVDNCISYYRVTYWDEANNPVTTYVNTKQFLVSGNIPACMNYTFQVNAIITGSSVGEGPVAQLSNVRYTEPPTDPKLMSVLTTNSSVEIECQLETYTENRCNMLYLNATTKGAPANMTYIKIPISDNQARPNVKLAITGLQPSTSYTSDVAVVNIGGVSGNITVNFQTNA